MRMPVVVTSLMDGGPSTPIDARISSVMADSGLVCSATRCPLSSFLYSAHAIGQCAAQVYPYRGTHASPASHPLRHHCGCPGSSLLSGGMERAPARGAPTRPNLKRLADRDDAELLHA